MLSRWGDRRSRRSLFGFISYALQVGFVLGLALPLLGTGSSYALGLLTCCSKIGLRLLLCVCRCCLQCCSGRFGNCLSSLLFLL